ncbi:MAG: type I polyketide synthase [Pseudomonadota bacterium]
MAAHPDELSRAVAIVGIGCRFPGGADSAKAFWQLLTEGRDAIAEIPADRIELVHYFNEQPATPGRIMTRWGGFLQGIEQFDAGFFGISPREAERLDPQQRLALETAWEALEDAGQDITALRGSTAGVFIGQWLSDFEGRLFADPEAVDFFMTTGSGRYATSGRLSYLLGLQGPSLTVDTACSSSLVAVHLAVRALRDGDCELALAGGVNVILQPHITIAYSQSRMMAPDGRCKFGDAAGDGYVRSEGAGLLVLKRLDRARADGDRIYAVIRGSAVNNDGQGSGSMGTPSRAGQAALLRKAYADAGVPPQRLGYVEAHGTGTRAGDPVELGALIDVLGEDEREAGLRTRVGSVKTNIGHTEGAAGVAGLIKTALALHHGLIPPSLHCRTPNPAVDWARAPVELVRQTTAWQGPDRLAGVSAFGIAGTNAHVVLQAAPSAAEPALAAPSPAPLVLSARSEEALRALAARYADAVPPQPGAAWLDLAFGAATRRAALEYRAAFAHDNAPALADALRRFAEGDPQPPIRRAAAERPRLAFVVPGQGAQWVGMGRELLEREPAFRSAMERCDAAAARFLDTSLVQQLRLAPQDPGYGLDRIDVIQPVLVAMAIAYAELWRAWGIEPDAVVGHSMGEVGAAAIAGALSIEQAMEIVCRRSALMRRTSGQGAMALVELGMEQAQQRLRGREAQVTVAVTNSPRSSVISGDPAAVEAVMAELQREGVFCRLVKVDVASHSPQMAPLAQALQQDLAGLVPQACRVPMVSTVEARRIEGSALDGAYWARNLREPVRFYQAVNALLDDGISLFVELGPHPVLLPSIEQTAQQRRITAAAVACGRREEPQQLGLRAALAELWTFGLPVDWRRGAFDGGRHVELPLYPWQRERHWADAAEQRPAGAGRGTTLPRLDEEAQGWLYDLGWDALPALSPSQPDAEGTWLVASHDRQQAAELAAALSAQGATAEAVGLEALADTLRRWAAGPQRPAGVLALPAPDDAGRLVLEVVQAVSSCGVAPRVWFLTRGAHAVQSPPAAVSVPAAALWGAARVAGAEHPEAWGGLVDLDPAVPASAVAPVLLAHLRAGDGEDQVALRGGRRHALRLAARASGRAGGFQGRPDASYLVTGGLGEIGLRIARTLAEAGARRIVLMGRTALPPREQWREVAADTAAGRRIAGVRQLEAMGVAVHLADVDVGDEAQLRSFLERHERQGLPPIRGVVHAAGSFANELVSRMSGQAFDAVVGPKLSGARLLDRLLPELDLFVLFSSTGGFLPQPGQANYAAANAGLDAVAHNRRLRGQPAQSIAWGVWAGTGLVNNDAGARNVQEMARQGLGSFAPERGAEVFRWLCGQAQPLTVVLPLDLAAMRRARGGKLPALMSGLAGAQAEAGTAVADVAAALAAAGHDERRRLLEAVVREAVSRVLKIPAARLDTRKALGQMGLNSLMAMELRNRLEEALQRPLSATLAWNHPTVEALVGYLAGPAPAPATVAPAAAPVSEPAAAPVSEPAAAIDVAAVAALSDDDALAALRSRRSRS